MRRRADYVEDGIISPKLFKAEPFRTIVADCPWPYGDKLPKVKTKDGGTERGATGTYKRGMTMDAIARYLESFAMMQELGGEWPEGFIAKDARLFLWRVAPMQEEALFVMKAWGFGAPVSELVWNKTTKDEAHIAATIRAFKSNAPETELLRRARSLSFGMGRTFRMSHETCLVGRRGRPELLSKSERSVFFAPTGEHSQKPEAFFEAVERISPGPYLELFSAGHRRPGWTCIGESHRVET